MPAFTAIASRLYKDPITTTYLNSIKQDLDYLVTGMAKAFVTFDSSAADISASILAKHNIASLVDGGVGQFVVNYTTGFAVNNGYVPICTLKIRNGDAGSGVTANIAQTGTAAFTSTSVRLTTSAGTDTDTFVYFAAIGAFA